MKSVAVLVCLAIPVLVFGQQGRHRGSSGGAVTAKPLQGVVITFQGKLKELSKKTILVEAEDGNLVTARRTSKTKFLSNGQEIQAADIRLESSVTLDVSEDNDLKLLAVALKLDPGQKQSGLVKR